jgi:prevent-host-death family protein
MPERQPDTETITATGARQHFASVINRVARKEARVVIEKSGVPVAAIVSADDIERLDQLDARFAARRKVLEAMREPFREVPPSEIERETERIVAEINKKR